MKGVNTSLHTTKAIAELRNCFDEYMKKGGFPELMAVKNDRMQVSYDILSEKTRKREIDRLLLAHRQTKCENLLLLTDHVYEEVDKEGVHIVIKPVYEWCTEITED